MAARTLVQCLDATIKRSREVEKELRAILHRLRSGGIRPGEGARALELADEFEKASESVEPLASTLEGVRDVVRKLEAEIQGRG